ncbi:putative zinc finger CCCH-type with G patch domain-containing protein [Apostichopus japonicus]|uniref:Putative zinc finger CCCH-type with G patch domain-containing protein n=1 Tax=Stichopus japonicus TaxID=307972 RepID=A0A2G8JIR0_STIJA|nr:putative zinc finger CCCH-type with G patch domain-containing protein [Apostichopus japonicus]
MDEKTLESSINTYRQQLQQVDTVLQSAGTEGQDELVLLKKDLEEVIQLTEESLLSLKKSRLMSFVEGTSSTIDDENDKIVENDSSRVLSMDEEYEAFKMMLSEDLKDDAQPSKESTQTSEYLEEAKSEMGMDADDDEDEDGDKIDLDLQEEVAGTKCSLMYSQEWGAKERHNAIILELEPKKKQSDEICVRVLFCNPTHQSMRPCPFFLDGKCKFDAETCRSLEAGSKCLARYDEDQLWYPAAIDSIEKEFETYKVEFESYGNSVVLGLDEILPRASHLESSSDEDDRDDETESLQEDVNLPSTSRGLPDSKQGDSEGVPTPGWNTTPGVALGQWEEHTRGIGSRLMAKMGYEYGQGLGKYNQGRTEIVEAVVLPPGKSLDKCMQLKAAKKCHVVGEKKKKTKGKSKNHSHMAKKAVRKRRDVFAFINNQLKGRKAKISDLLHQNIELVKTDKRLLWSKAEPTSGRQINIQLVKTQEEISSTNKEITRLRQSLDRHERDKKTCQQLEFKIAEKKRYLESLAASEKKLERQQATRNHHRKLTIF